MSIPSLFSHCATFINISRHPEVVAFVVVESITDDPYEQLQQNRYIKRLADMLDQSFSILIAGIRD